MPYCLPVNPPTYIYNHLLNDQIAGCKRTGAGEQQLEKGNKTRAKSTMISSNVHILRIRSPNYYNKACMKDNNNSRAMV